MMIDNLLSKSSEELCEWFRAEVNKVTFGTYCNEYKRRLEEYSQKIENDFNEEWSRKHFKWFFTKYRQKKLRAQIAHRYTTPVFWIIEDMIEDMLPQTINENFQQLVDIKDVALGEKAYFAKEDTNVLQK